MKDALRYLAVVAICIICVIWIAKSGLYNKEVVYFPR